MEKSVNLPTRAATPDEEKQMSAPDLFLYNHGVDLFIYGDAIMSLNCEDLPKEIRIRLRKNSHYIHHLEWNSSG